MGGTKGAKKTPRGERDRLSRGPADSPLVEGPTMDERKTLRGDPSVPSWERRKTASPAEATPAGSSRRITGKACDSGPAAVFPEARVSPPLASPLRICERSGDPVRFRPHWGSPKAKAPSACGGSPSVPPKGKEENPRSPGSFRGSWETSLPWSPIVGDKRNRSSSSTEESFENPSVRFPGRGSLARSGSRRTVSARKDKSSSWGGPTEAEGNLGSSVPRRDSRGSTISGRSPGRPIASGSPKRESTGEAEPTGGWLGPGTTGETNGAADRDGIGDSDSIKFRASAGAPSRVSGGDGSEVPGVRGHAGASDPGGDPWAP